MYLTNIHPSSDNGTWNTAARAADHTVISKPEVIMFELKGIYCPIATPFVNGEIAYDKLDKNMEFWNSSKEMISLA